MRNEMRPPRPEQGPENKDVQPPLFERAKAALGKGLDVTLKNLDLSKVSGEGVLSALREAAKEIGVPPEAVQFSLSEIEGEGSSGEVVVGTSVSNVVAKKGSSKGSVPKVLLAGMMLAGCAGEPAPKPAKPGSVRSDETCGPVVPEFSPTECGQQQWRGFSEANPAATAWLAIANVGPGRCDVTVTNLELTYSVDHDPTKQRVLVSGIRGAQNLSKGENKHGDYWGQYQSDTGLGPHYEVLSGYNRYIHPFTTMTQIPENATELTISFSAEIDEGCVVQGGMDTYQEHSIPTTEPPYTQDGSVTDFIKEAIKTPWYGETIPEDAPVSFSIERDSSMERTWYKGKDEE